MSETIYIPCRVLTVDITVCPSDGLSPLEKLVLEAINSGITDAYAVDDVFFLGLRPTLDLLWDLWRRTYLTIDLRTGKLSLSDEVRTKIEEGTLDELTGATDVKPVWLLQETLAGHLLRLKGRPWLARGSRIVPTRSIDEGELPVRSEELVFVLERVLASTLSPGGDFGRGRDLRVLGFSVNTTPSIRTSEQRLIELTIEPSIDPSSGCLSLPIIGPSELSSIARLDMQRALERLADMMSTQPWVKQLNEKARYIQSESESDLLAVVSTLASEISVTPVDQTKALDEHERRMAFAEIVLSRVRRARASRVAITPLRNVAEQRNALMSLVADARRQLVLSAPELKFEALFGLESVLRRQLVEDVRVIVIWGRSPDATLRTDVANSLDAVLSETQGELLWPRASSRTASSFVIQDNQVILLTTDSLLNPVASQPGGESTCGLLVESLDDSAAFANDLLWWSKRRCAEATIGQMIDPYGIAPELLEESTLPTRPSAPILDGGPAIAEASMALWEQSWQVFAQDLIREVRHLGWWAESVLDVQHRTHLWNLLRRRNSFLVILSHSLNSNVANHEFFTALNEKLLNGTKVVLGNHEFSPRRAEEDNNVQDSIRKLTREFPTLFHHRRIGARVEIAADDTSLLLSSFGMLSNSNETASKAVGWRRPADVGILLRHAGGVDAVTAVLRYWGVVPDSVLEVSVDAEKGIPAQAQRLFSRDLQPLLKACGRASSELERGDILRDWFAGQASPQDAWRLLKAFEDMRFPYMEVAAASCIWSRRLDDDPGDRSSWLSRLATWVWSRGEFVEAAILLDSIEAGPQVGKLPPWLVDLAAAQELGAKALDIRLMEAALRDDLTLDTRDALVALTAVELLRTGSTGADAGLEELLASDAPITPTRNMAAAVRSFFEMTGAAFPRDQIRAMNNAADDKLEAEEGYQRLIRSLSEAESVSFDFDLGKRSWAAIFSDEGALGQMKQIILKEDRHSMEIFLKTHGSRRPDAERMINEATARTARKTAAWLGTDSRLMGGKRQQCVARVAQLLFDANSWVKFATTAEVGPDPRFRPWIEALAAAVHDNRLELVRTAGDNGVKAPLVRRLLEELSVLELSL